MLFEGIQGSKVDGRHSGDAQERAGLAARHLIGATRSPGVPPVSDCSARAKVWRRWAFFAMPTQHFFETAQESSNAEWSQSPGMCHVGYRVKFSLVVGK
jgi:hypothetical protein